MDLVLVQLLEMKVVIVVERLLRIASKLVVLMNGESGLLSPVAEEVASLLTRRQLSACLQRDDSV